MPFQRVMKDRLWAAAICSLSMLATACGGGDRPPPTNHASVATQDVGDEAPPAVYTDTCNAGESRFCRFYYVDFNGQVHCPIKTQYCRADGNGWLPCGAPPIETE